MIVLALMLMAVAGLSACGGDDDDGNGGSAPASDDSGDDQDNASDNGAGDSDDGADDGDDDAGDSDCDDGSDDSNDSGGFDFGAGKAVVTVGDKTFEFDLTSGSAVCRDVFGGLQVGGRSTDDENVTLDMWIPPTNWDTYDDNRYDPPSVEVEDDTSNKDWVADLNSAYEIEEGKSQVDSYEKDGLRASGTATFTDVYALFSGSAETVQGTFEVSCEE